MNWELFFAGVGAASALLIGNAYLMKITMRSILNEALLTIAKEYLTKVEFDKHIEHCPNMRKSA